MSLDWNIKNMIGNKELNEVNRLFVELILKIQKTDLKIETHSLSFSLPEFKVSQFCLSMILEIYESS